MHVPRFCALARDRWQNSLHFLATKSKRDARIWQNWIWERGSPFGLGLSWWEPRLACEGRWERLGIQTPRIVKRCRLLDGISGNKMEQKVSWGVQTEWGREPWGYVRNSKLDKGNHSEKALTWKTCLACSRSSRGGQCGWSRVTEIQSWGDGGKEGGKGGEGPTASSCEVYSDRYIEAQLLPPCSL